eukprot:SAG22_NODE_8931_length_620_cov_1.376200_1_plen_43_part_10
MFNWETEQEENLGPTSVSWAVRFKMPDHDDPKTWSPLRDIDDD